MNDRHLPQHREHADMRWLGEYETIRLGEYENHSILFMKSIYSWNR